MVFVVLSILCLQAICGMIQSKGETTSEPDSICLSSGPISPAAGWIRVSIHAKVAYMPAGPIETVDSIPESCPPIRIFTTSHHGMNEYGAWRVYKS